MRLEPLYQQEKEKLEREAEQRGEERAQKRFARNLLSMGMGIEQIAQATGLSPEEVTKLIKRCYQISRPARILDNEPYPEIKHPFIVDLIPFRSIGATH